MPPPRSAQFRLWLRFGLVVALAGGGATVSAADPPLHPKPLPILLRGQVTAFELAKGNLTSPATVKVVHVYSGDAKLVGKPFTDYYQPFGNGHSAPLFSAIRPFTVGEVGVWTLTESNVRDEGKRFAVVARQTPSQTLTKEPASMKLPLEWAEAVEKYAQAAPKERGEMLPKLLRSPNPLIAHWVAERLGEEDSKESGEFLDKLLADKLVADLPVPVQLTLDGVLCARTREDWLASPMRKSMTKRWVTGKPDGWHGIWVMSRLSTVGENGDLPPAEVHGLLKIGAENKDWTEAERLEAIRLSGEIAGRTHEDDTAFDWLLELLRTHKDLAVRRAATRGLTWIPLYPARMKAVEQHLPSETDQQIKGWLEATIQKTKEADKKKSHRKSGSTTGAR